MATNKIFVFSGGDDQEPFEVDLGLIENQADNITNTITKNRVEVGSDRTDHIKKEPVSITMSGLVTSADINRDPSYYINLRSVLDTSLTNGWRVTLQTKKSIYEDLVIKSFTPTRNADFSDAYLYTITFEEIKTTKTKFVQIPRRLIGKKGNSKTKQKNTKDSFSKNAQKNKSSKTNANEKLSKKGESIAVTLLKGLGAVN